MLYFFVGPQRSPLYVIGYISRHEICCDWTCDWVSLFIVFNNMIDYVSTQLVYFPWIYLSSFSHMTQSNSFQSWSSSIEYDSLFLIRLSYSESDVLTFNFRTEDCGRLFPSLSEEYDWLGSELTWNKWGRYILILTVVLITPGTVHPSSCPISVADPVSHYAPLERRLL